MKRTIWLGFLGLLAVAGVAFSGGFTTNATYQYGAMQRMDLAWTANPALSCTGSVWIQGSVIAVSFSNSPPAAGVTYTLKDESGVDHFAGLGANVSTAAVTTVAPGIIVQDASTTTNTLISYPTVGNLTLLVTNTSTNATGNLTLYWLKQ